AVTFTRVAAEDLHRELQKMEVPGCENLEGRTLHSLALQILSRQHVLEALGRHARPLNRFEVGALVSDLAPSFGGKDACKDLISGYEAAWAQSQGDDPGFAKDKIEEAFNSALHSWMRFHESMLIGEVVPYFVKYLKQNPLAPEHLEYKHLLIDEYQDLNKAEQSALAYLGAKATVCVVGDDDQSIYSFKSAYPDGIRQWKDAHPGCGDLAMTECHRCPTSVVAMANSLIAKNQNRTERNLDPIEGKGPGHIEVVQLANPEAEADWVAKKISQLINGGAEPSDVIVLAQRSRIAKRILEKMVSKRIPAKSYYDESQLDSLSAQVRFSLLKLVLNSEDRVALRFLLGVGQQDFRAPAYARLRVHCEEVGITPWQALEKLESGELTIKYASHLVAVFSKLKAEIETLKAASADLPNLIEQLFPPDQAEISELRSLALSTLGSGEVDSVEELFKLMMKEITQPDIRPSIEEVRVMSLHKSKGLSSPHVFIVGCIQGILPQAPSPNTPIATVSAQLEEARRLFFVGITRVKADPGAGKLGSLYLTYPREMGAGLAAQAKIAFHKVVYGKAQLQPSIFLGELGPQCPNPVAG
ncbi:MAG TPA: ATP-dependent helicase, partial [Caulobacter sp.]|nr:ATP-dependent helicase [Caulobacter sp.]